MLQDSIVFLLLGLSVGGIGTLMGAGGGFILAPVLLFLYPSMDPARLTALSLLAVSANSVSGSIAYKFKKQIHWPSVFLFSMAGVPGVFAGVALNDILSREKFEFTFAIFLISMSIFVTWRSFRAIRSTQALEDVPWNKRAFSVGCFLSFFIGIISSLLGIGGGIIHVPLLVEFLKYPVHIAAGTSHALLAITSVVAVTSHFAKGDLAHLETWVPYMVIGLVIGAQIGALFSKKVKGWYIFRLLGVALFTVGLRLLWRNL